jgi:hypothetical protein
LRAFIVYGETMTSVLYSLSTNVCVQGTEQFPRENEYSEASLQEYIIITVNHRLDYSFSPKTTVPPTRTQLPPIPISTSQSPHLPWLLPSLVLQLSSIRHFSLRRAHRVSSMPLILSIRRISNPTYGEYTKSINISVLMDMYGGNSAAAIGRVYHRREDS